AVFPFPVGQQLSDQERKELGRILDYQVDTAPADVLPDTNNGTRVPEDDEILRRIVWSRCLTDTRRNIARSVDACIVLGGKESGFLGRYPGVVEEALIALEEETPLFLVGLLGGAAQSIFHMMTKTRKGDLPPAFDEEALLSRPGISHFQKAYNARFPGK